MKYRNIICIGIILILQLLFGSLEMGMANDIKVRNIDVKLHSKIGHHLVELDLEWSNSWRNERLFTEDGHDVGNWDAAWIFIKYKLSDGSWAHAKLANEGYSLGSESENTTLSIGLLDDGTNWHRIQNPGVGAMVHPGVLTDGVTTLENIQLLWDYQSDGLSISDPFTLKVFAIEMVYVAPGSFFVGIGPASHHSFLDGTSENSENSESKSFHVNSTWNGCISNDAGCLWSEGGGSLTNGTLNSKYPTGLEGFYVMKYETSQQQYADFLNTLPADQAQARISTSSGTRQNIIKNGDLFETTTPHVPKSLVNWIDAAAYLDWAGLRPMTELEYEKASRGPLKPVHDEYAWGTTVISPTGGISNYSNLGDASEQALQGNAIYDDGNPDGPARVGLFATSSSNREASGGSYFGVMELSGNLHELVVSAADVSGRSFTGVHGDGALSESGLANVDFWPGGGNSGVTTTEGTGWRGGCYSCPKETLAISSRLYAQEENTDRVSTAGFRGVRSFISTGTVTLTTMTTGMGSVNPISGVYSSGNTVQITATPSTDWEFLGWSGDIPSSANATDNSLSLTMNESKVITAEFVVRGKDRMTEIVEVLNSETGKTWMDRNLGASRAATIATDSEAYGDYYQWGRAADGHEKQTSVTTSALSSTDDPGHGDFIVAPNGSYDWRNPQNNNLWNGVNGINNPCPNGYRLPTKAEWAGEMQTWRTGPYNSPTKLTKAGFRSYDSGAFVGVGSQGRYWSGTVQSFGSIGLLVYDTSFRTDPLYRADGASVRCIKD